MKIKIERMHPEILMPAFATKGAAAFDIRAYIHPVDRDKTITISNGDTLTVGTGLKMEIPEGHGLFIFSRSGHGFVNDVRLSNCVGVIDSDYRGEIFVKLHADFNYGASPLTIKHGDRIAQGVVMKLPKVEFVEGSLSATERGEGGIGSTGNE